MIGDIVSFIIIGGFVGFCLTAVVLIIYDEKNWRNK
jgi:hypothetical protein